MSKKLNTVHTNKTAMDIPTCAFVSAVFPPSTEITDTKKVANTEAKEASPAALPTRYNDILTDI